MERAQIRSLAVLAVALVLVLGACTSDWATWGNGRERHGENVLERRISLTNVHQLTEQWSVDLGAISNTAPVVAANLLVNGRSTDLIYVGSEHGMFYAIARDGTVVWSRDLGSRTTNCADTPDGTFGVTASAAFDRANKRVYVAGGDGYVHAFDAVSGAGVPGWPVQITTDPTHEVVWGGLQLVDDHLYVPIGSHCTAAPYHGRIVDISPTSQSIQHTFWVTDPAGPSGGGVWGWGGVSVDLGSGDLFAATGNGLADPENFGYADAVLRLSSSLELEQYDKQPVTIRNDDYGSTPVLFQAPNCPRQFVVERKNGSLYLYDRDAISSGYRQRIEMGTPNFFGVPAYSNATKMVYVVNQKGSPDGTYVPGLAAFKVNASCKLTLAWQTRLATSNATAPSVANGVVFLPSGGSGKVYALNALTGELLWDSGTTLTGRAYSQAVVVNGFLYAVSWDHRLHAWTIPPNSATTTAP